MARAAFGRHLLGARQLFPLCFTGRRDTAGSIGNEDVCSSWGMSSLRAHSYQTFVDTSTR